MLLMVVMAMMMMVAMLQGQVGRDHLAGGPGHGAIVEGVVRHAVLGPASGLAEKGERICMRSEISVSCLYSTNNTPWLPDAVCTKF